VSEAGDRRDAPVRDYIGVLWRRKWLIIAMVAVFFVAALGYSFTKTPLYQASAVLIYEGQLDVANALSGGQQYVDPTQREAELNAVADVIASPDLVARVQKTPGVGEAGGSYSVGAAPQQSANQSSTSTVVVTVVGPDPQVAARIANAYAKSFVDYRKERAQAQVRQAEEVVQSKLDAFTSDLSKRSAEYVTLTQRLQELQILEATVTGNFRLLVPANAPSAPFTPKPWRNGIVGLVSGLVLGVVLVFALDQFDTRIRTSEEVAAIFDMPVVGRIPRLSREAIERAPMAVVDDSTGSAAEAVRKLRGNLEFANVDGDLKSVFITSALQHEGKSLVACNLALSLAATGANVILVDADMRRPQTHAYLRLRNGVGLATVLTGRSKLSDAIQTTKVGPTLTTIRRMRTKDAGSDGSVPLRVLTSGPVPPNPAEILASRSFSSLIEQLQADFDMVIVDAPSTLAVGDPAAIARTVDGLLFLVDTGQARKPVLEEASAQVKQMPCRKLGLVLVGLPSKHGYSQEYMRYYAHEQPAGDPAKLALPGESALL
jgi:polysaccharide biosynthesis transport protein